MIGNASPKVDLRFAAALVTDTVAINKHADNIVPTQHSLSTKL